MGNEKHRICPVERAGSLDNRIRKWFQDPHKILRPYLREGMKVMDLGCGPGFFSIEMAQLVGKSGRVIASDLQEGMLQKIRDKIEGTELADRIILQKCEADTIGAPENFDFILAFYMLHEVVDQDSFFKELHALIKPAGQVLIVEPPFHVSKTTFENMIETARAVGFEPVKRPNILLSKAVLLKRKEV